ncbi:hypothetical protein GOBAR_DD23771 [Gossypium barbadense]|nr:hypothetical protein GOBAR_DD23771 [Gossypium barbadense]
MEKKAEESSSKRALKNVCCQEEDPLDVGDHGLMEGGGLPLFKLVLMNGMLVVENEKLMDLDNDYYIMKFQTKADYEKALTEGLWMIYGQYLTMQPWSPLFSTQEEYPMQVVVWI